MKLGLRHLFYLLQYKVFNNAPQFRYNAHVNSVCTCGLKNYTVKGGKFNFGELEFENDKRETTYVHIDRIFLSIVGKSTAWFPIDIKLIGDWLKQDGIRCGHHLVAAVAGPGVREEGSHPLGEHAFLGGRISQVRVRIVRVDLPRVRVVRQLPGEAHSGGRVDHDAAVQF